VFPKLSLPLRLALLVAGTALPLIVFAGAIVHRHHQQDREAAFERVLQTVRGMRFVLDREMQSVTSALQVLALSDELQRGDLAGFRRDVEAFLSQFPEPPTILLSDRDGSQVFSTQVFNTRVPFGEPLPPRTNRESAAEVFTTGHPAYSRLFTGSVSNQPIVTVEVPVRRAGDVVYAISFTPPFATFQRIIDQQRPSEEWTVSIFDQTGVNFARVPNPEQTIGARASPTLYAALFKQDEAKLITISLEGVELITAFTRSPLTGWTVAAGIPTATITGPLWRTLAITGSIGVVLLGIGLAFAVRMATQIARGEALHALLVNELNHRVKNTLATIQSIASQTLRNAPDPADARRKFEARLVALGRAHDALSEDKWQSADLREIVDGVLETYAAKDSRRLHVSGPPLQLPPRCALMMSMVLHELATNAAKYGALSDSRGEIFVDWVAFDRDDREMLRLHWKEAGGPPVRPVERKGFGSTLIEQGIAGQLGGSAKLEFAAAGLVCTIECPIA
jgi:two-component sensor histidine kinase